MTTKEEVKELSKKGLITEVYFEDYASVNLSGDIDYSEGGVYFDCAKGNPSIEFDLHLSDISNYIYLGVDESYINGENHYFDHIDEDVKSYLCKEFDLKENVKIKINLGIRVVR